ncbi:NmrA family protein, partial [Coprinopsis marcescibilis]
MTTLITGGGSTVGSHLAQLLKTEGRNVLFASRSGRVPEGFDSVKLEWDEPATFHNPWTQRSLDIDSVYIVGPPADFNPLKQVGPFIDLAVTKGVKRFVYLSATEADKNNDSGGLGQVPGYLEERGLDYVVLRPTWFIDNLGTQFAYKINQFNLFETIVPTGRIPFVAAEDIARVGAEFIVTKNAKYRDPVIIGPELLRYDEVAAILSDVIGRTVTHNAVSNEVFKDHLRGTFPEHLIDWLLEINTKAEGGSEEKYPHIKEKAVGKITVREWVKQNKALFEP